jgi:peptidyl-prolyl cis-trans isomerase D
MIFVRKIADFGWKKALTVCILVLVAVSFCLVGAMDYFRSSTSNPNFIKIGGKTFKMLDYENYLSGKKGVLISQFGHSISENFLNSMDFKNIILQDFVLSEMIKRELKSEFGMQIPQTLLRDLVRLDKRFFKAGSFDVNFYQAFLNFTKLSEAQLYQEKRGETERNLLLGSSVATFKFDKSFLDKLYELEYEPRSVDIVRLSLDPNAVSITDEEVRDFYEKNKADFYESQKRDIAYVDIYSEVAKNPEIKPTQAEVDRAFEQVIVKSKNTDLRDFYQIAFDTQQQAELALKQLKSGVSFVDIAKTLNKSPSDITFVKAGPSDIIAPLWDVIIRLKDGDLTGVIKTDIGFHIIKLLKTHSSKNSNPASLKTQIYNNLLQQKICQTGSEYAQDFQKRMLEGGSLQKIADELNFSVKKTGLKTFNELKSILPQKTLDYAFKSSDIAGFESLTEVNECSSFAWRINTIQPRHSLEFDMVKSDVKAGLQQKKVDKFLMDLGAKFYESSKAKKAFDLAVLDESKVFYKLEKEVVLNRYSQTLKQSLIVDIFNAKKNSFVRPYVLKPNEVAVVFVKSFNTPTNENRPNFDKKIHDFQNFIYADYVNFLYKKYKVSLNSTQKD